MVQLCEITGYKKAHMKVRPRTFVPQEPLKVIKAQTNNLRCMLQLQLIQIVKDQA
jgi:hypothetical protein